MRKNALVLILAALPFTACKCHGNLNGTNGALVASPNPIAFGPRGFGTKSVIHVVITNQGDAPVNITAQPTFQNDTNHAFSAIYPMGDGGTNPLPIDLEVAATANMDVTYDPPKEENDEDAGITITVQNDSNAALVVPLQGNGVDPCFDVVCDAGVAGIGQNPGGCYGTCQAGKCVYAGPCSDKSQCLSNGTCNPSTGACQGTFDCAQPGAGTCSGNVLTGDVAPGSCDQGTGTCLYNHQTVTCDCSCVQSGSNASCSYSWQPVQGLPTGSVASVWSAGKTAGDLWLSVINGSSAGINPNTVYQQVNGAWNQVAQVGNAFSALCSGPGCGLALMGSSDTDVYGVTDCTVPGAAGACTTGGAWHYTGTAADEVFPSLGGVSMSDLPLTTILDIGGTGFALNSDPTGPELVSGSGGTWSILYNTEWHCQSQGAIWGTSPSDIWLSWGCNAKGGSVLPGQLQHYNGTGLDTPAFTLPSGEYAEGLWGTSDSDIWAAGTHRWHYDGTTWTQDPVAPPGGNADQTVWGNGTDYFAGGGYIALYHWTSAADWTEECIAPGYEDPSVYSFASDGTNFYATTSSTTAPGLVQRCPNGTCP
jgi:hypothetical protein